MPVPKLGILASGVFEEKKISSNGILDIQSGMTVTQHMNDESIHVPEEDFSDVAFTGKFSDLLDPPVIRALTDAEFSAAFQL
jgi:hypothetical protein